MQYVGVWIDHASARIVELTAGRAPAFKTLLSHAESRHRSTGQSGVPPPGHIGGNTESHYQNRREEHLHRFYDQVLESITSADGLAIMGPGEAKSELLTRMERINGLRARALQTETTTRLSDEQILARVKGLSETANARKLSAEAAPQARCAPASRRDVDQRSEAVVMAASAGGIKALGQVLECLPTGFPAAIAIVQHRGPTPPDVLPSMLAKRSRLRVKNAEDGELFSPGIVYLAPCDEHLSIKGDRRLALTNGRKIRHLRSSANPLFDSAARVFGKRVIAVVLTGGDSDATDGVQAIHTGGGVVITQDPATCECPAMPMSAHGTGVVDRVLPLHEIGPAIVSLVTRGIFPGPNGGADAEAGPREDIQSD